jgi:hypothetical protein
MGEKHAKRIRQVRERHVHGHRFFAVSGCGGPGRQQTVLALQQLERALGKDLSAFRDGFRLELNLPLLTEQRGTCTKEKEQRKNGDPSRHG